MNCPGGVNRDIGDPTMVLDTARIVAKTTSETLIPVLSTEPHCCGALQGRRSTLAEQALAYGALGPTARASGLGQDLRKDAPYEAYDQIEFAVPVFEAGDVYARVVARALEIVESCKIIAQAIEMMPEGRRRVKVPSMIPAGEGCSRIEGNRGEVFYYVASDGTNTPARIRIRTPTFSNMPTVRLMVQGANLADVPLIQASVDPCYSCTDR